LELVGITYEKLALTSIVRSEMTKERVAKMGSEPTIWAVGGGKGGVGKSVVSILLAYWLARMGKRTVVADFDLGGGNIHTLMGIKSPPHNLYDFVAKKCSSIEDICIKTPVENLRLIAGASGVLSLANPQFSQKEKLIKHLAKLNADYVVLDLGAGTSFSVLDFFLAANQKIVVLTPEPTSIQNAYIFLRNAVYRMLSRLSRKSESLQAVIKSAMNPKNELNVRTVREVLQYVEDMGRENFAEPLRKELGLIRPAVIVNMARNDKEKNASRIIQVTSEKYLMINSVDIGNVFYDEQLPRMIDNMAPLVQVDGSCTAVANTYEIVRKLLGDEEPDRISAYAA
jgi:flagellar biosynthesis protein FlhG